MRSFVTFYLVCTTIVHAQTPSPTISAARPVPGQVPNPVVSSSGTLREGMADCGGQAISLSEYNCLKGHIVCPKPQTKVCGDTCYNESEYHCIDEVLVHGGAQDDKSEHALQGPAHEASNHYKIPVPGRGAYGQLLHDLGKDGIHPADIEKIRGELDKVGIDLLSTQVAVLLRDPMGSQAGLRQFETTLTVEERNNFDKAMPQIKVILADAAKTKSAKSSSGLVNKPTNHTSTSTTKSTPSTSEQPGTPGSSGVLPAPSPGTPTVAKTTSTSTGATTGEIVPSVGVSLYSGISCSIAFTVGIILLTIASM